MLGTEQSALMSRSSRTYYSILAERLDLSSRLAILMERSQTLALEVLLVGVAINSGSSLYGSEKCILSLLLITLLVAGIAVAAFCSTNILICFH